MSLVAGTPDWGIAPGVSAAIDAEACDESSCSKCGHVGLKYEPFVDRDEQIYIAFAACPKPECGYREEF